MCKKHVVKITEYSFKCAILILACKVVKTIFEDGFENAFVRVVEYPLEYCMIGNSEKGL